MSGYPQQPEWVEALVTATEPLTASDLSRMQPAADEVTRQSAVLILFAGDTPDTADVLLLERASTLRSHAGQVAFPGGATDPEDGSATATALREATEEVGLDASSVTVLTELPELFLPPSKFMVTPVVGFWHSPHPVAAMDAGEVAQVDRVRLTDLLEPANRFSVIHSNGYRSAGFQVGSLFIWGFTAALLSNLLRRAGLERPWDQAVLRSVPAVDAPLVDPGD